MTVSVVLTASGLLWAMAGCTGKTPTADTGGTSGDGGSGYTSVETGIWTDTGDGGDGGTADGGADGGTPAAVLTHLALYPETMKVAPGATWKARVLADYDDGTHAVVDASFSSDVPDVLQVDADGVVTALSRGRAAIVATVDDQQVTMPYDVVTDHKVVVHVFDAATGDPLEGMRVRVGQASTWQTEGVSNRLGKVELDYLLGEAFEVTSWGHDRVPATVFDVVSREVRVPLRALDAIDPVIGSVTGSVDLDGVPTGGAGDIKIGIALPSLVDGPLLIDTDRLAGPNREVTLYGVTANVPSNIYVRDAAETYELPAAEGSTGVWTVAAPMPIDDVTSGMAGATDALGVMLEHLADVAWDWTEGVTLEAGGSGTANLAPDTPLALNYAVDVGDLSVGFSGDEDALVLVGDVLAEQGFAPIGVGVGTGDVTVHAAAVSLGGDQRIASAIAQVGSLGAGTGYGICTSWAPLGSTGATLPTLQRVPSLDLFDPATHDFSVHIDDRVAFVHAEVRGGGDSDEVRDLYFGGGTQAHTLPDLNAPFGYGHTTWDIVAIETTAWTWQDLARSGRLDAHALAADAWTAGMLTQEP